MEKVRYEIDPHNRLVALLPRFRKAIDGKFKIDKKNTLSYRVKAPVPRGANIPHQVKLRGEWSLDKNHDLKLTLDKWGRRTFGDQLTLQGNIIDARKNSLLFAVTTKTKENVRSTYVLNLRGRWQADKNNRLTFRARKEKGRHDILTFGSIWEINKHHRIIYRYKKARLIRKKKKVHTLAFNGYWDIRGKARISYVMDRNTESAFHFRPGIGVFRDGYVKYELGIGLSGRRKPVKKTVTLFGTWKLTKNTGLLFEVKYENRKIRAMAFGAKARLSGGDTVSFSLRNAVNKDIGAQVKLSRKILKGAGEVFLRALKSKRKAAIFVGSGWIW